MSSFLEELAGGYARKQLVVPFHDLGKVAAAAKNYLVQNQADPELQKLSDADMISLSRAVNEAVIDYCLGKLESVVPVQIP